MWPFRKSTFLLRGHVQFIIQSVIGLDFVAIMLSVGIFVLAQFKLCDLALVNQYSLSHHIQIPTCIFKNILSIKLIKDLEHSF